MSAATTSTPSAASSRAFSEFTSRVIARAWNGPFGSAAMARTSPPPCAPVAPMTAMIFLLSMFPPDFGGHMLAQLLLGDDGFRLAAEELGGLQPALLGVVREDGAAAADGVDDLLRH